MNRLELKNFITKENKQKIISLNKFFKLCKKDNKLFLHCSMTNKVRTKELKTKNLDLLIIEIKLEIENIIDEIKKEIVKDFIINL